jgi:hypothetical protein
MKMFKFDRIKFLRSFALLLVISCFISCVKQEVISDLDFQKSLLAGSGSFENTSRNWKLDSLTENGLVLKLPVYQITFNSNGTLVDSDGYPGTWLMPTTKDLTIVKKTKFQLTNKFQIININSAQLHLKYDSAGIKQDLHFVIFN